jgi:hypothetical protein
MHFARCSALAGFSALALTFSGSALAGQNEAPFTIRRPPDGSTVREKVRIQVPLASIPEGGYVSFRINGVYRVALAPSDEQRQNAKPGEMFEWVWDTKAPFKPLSSPKEILTEDGTYEITAALYAPKGGSAGGSVLKQTSSVKVNLANKIPGDPGPLRLRYRFPDGSTKNYSRTGDTSIVAGLTQGMNATGDRELVSQRSKLLMAVEDVYKNGNAIVRNKLTNLIVRQGGHETEYPVEMLPKSLYQEVDAIGAVQYQNNTVSFDEFSQMGIPVTATLDLPLLPANPVRINDKWQTPGVVLDIPGTAPKDQPKVTVNNTFEAVEYEGRYPTARIRQTYEGPLRQKSVIVNGYEIEGPSVKFDRTIWVAYQSGTLVKVFRKLELSGKTAQMVDSTGGFSPGMGGGGGASMGSGGLLGPAMAGGGSSMGSAGPGMAGGRGRMGSGGLMGAPGLGGGGARGRTSGGGMMGPGAPGAGGARGRMASGGLGGGRMGASALGGSADGGDLPGRGRMGGGMSGAGIMGPPGMGGMMGGGTGPAQKTSITIKSTLTTELEAPANTASR